MKNKKSQSVNTFLKILFVVFILLILLIIIGSLNSKSNGVLSVLGNIFGV
jgi:hypothetical protein